MVTRQELFNAGAKRLTLPGETITTTFYGDFSIADYFGADAIKDTFNTAFSEWKNDYRYLTNLVVTLNHKSWEYADNNEGYASLYNELYEKANDYALVTLKGDELTYFFDITD